MMRMITSILGLALLLPGPAAYAQADKAGDTRPQTVEEIKAIAENYGQFAPEDAWVEDPDFAYYGSENEWTRRQFSAVRAEMLYKRRGQRQLLEILEGNIDEAISLAQFRLDEDAEDAESCYILAVAHSVRGEVGKAMNCMDRALQNGMEFSRFLAGPRDLLKNLTNSTAFQAVAQEKRVGLIHGPMLGSVTSEGARFWFRTVGEDTVEVRCYDQSGRLAGMASGRSEAAADYTVVVMVEGLQSGTEYRYDVVVNGTPVRQDTGLTFRTYPEKGSSGSFKVGIGGCAGYTPKYEYMWSTLASRQLDALLLLGDNVYIDLPEMPGAFHGYTYYRRQSQPDFRKLGQSTALYAIWDDHDAATDDVWMGPYKDRPVWKQPMVEVFQRNWANPGGGGPGWPGCWFQFSLGDVDIFMLDGRTYRTNPHKEEKTMLGPVQKEWLLSGLKASQATFKVIASPVAWVSEAKPGSKDTWNGFIEEREEIFRYLSQNRIEGVVLLSGDRHRTDFWINYREGDYPLYEMSSSRLTNIHTADLMPGAIFGYNEKPSFGVLNFHTGLEDPEVQFEIVSIDDELIYAHTLSLSQLSYPRR